jgi:hypothetical protein
LYDVLLIQIIDNLFDSQLATKHMLTPLYLCPGWESILTESVQVV